MLKESEPIGTIVIFRQEVAVHRRLGKIIYWAFCVLTVLWLAVNLWFDGGRMSEWDTAVFLMILGGAVVLWTIGFAVRFVLLAE